MIIVEFSVTLIGVGTSISNYVSEALKIILKAHKAVIKAGALRVITSVKIDDRRDEKSVNRG